VRLKEYRLQRLRALSGFTFHKLDISENASVEKLPAFNAVINQAVRAGVRASVEDQVKILSKRVPMRYGVLTPSIPVSWSVIT